MFKIFYKTDNDDRIVVVHKNKEYSVKELKMYIAGRIDELKNVQENVVISSDNSFAFIINFFASIFTNKNIFLISDRNRISKLNLNAVILDDSVGKKISDYQFPYVDIDKPIINCYTSGTSSNSQCIQKSLYNLITEADDIVNEFNFKSKTFRIVSSTTMCHLFGLTFHLMLALISDGIIYTDKILYPELNVKDCIFISTPSFLNYFEKHNIDFEYSPEYIISAGSKLSNETFEYLEKKTNIIEIYGSTESGAIAYKLSSKEKTFTPLAKVNVSKDSSNNLVVNTKYSIDKKVVIPDNVDILNGKILLKERNDRIVKVYEKRINLEEQELYLKKLKYISDVYCLKHNEKLVAVVVLSETGKKYLLSNGILTLKKMLKNYCNQNFEIIPQRWRFVSEIPSTAFGKIDKTFIDFLFSSKFSFPIILDKEMNIDNVNFKLFLPNNSNFYKGHFPEFPITPGVVLLYIAHTLSKRVFNLSNISSDMRRVKFIKVLKPDSIVDLSLKKNDKNIEYIYSNEDSIFSSGNFPIIKERV